MISSISKDTDNFNFVGGIAGFGFSKIALNESTMFFWSHLKQLLKANKNIDQTFIIITIDHYRYRRSVVRQVHYD